MKFENEPGNYLDFRSSTFDLTNSISKNELGTDLWFEDHTHLRTYSINELGKWICVNVSIDTAVEPSGLCGLVVRTFVARYGTRLLGLWGSQVRILSEANFSHIFRDRVC